MINSIVDAICLALREEFGSDYQIHSEQVEQGLREPCFFISCLSPTKNLFLGKRYFRKNLFCIQYFPETKQKKAECNMVVERLSDCLEYITVDGQLIRGTKMNNERSNGILNFFINYDMFIYVSEDGTNMGDLSQTDTQVRR